MDGFFPSGMLETGSLPIVIHEKGNPFVFPMGSGADPMPFKILLRINHHAASGVGNMEAVFPPSGGYFEQHHKMLLFPMEDDRQGGFLRQKAHG